MTTDYQSLLFPQIFIGNKWYSTSKTFEVHNPANGKLIAAVADASAADAERAVQAAAAAFPSWSQAPAKERAAVLHQWFALIQQHKDALAALLTAEQGKPLKEAAGEVQYGASFIEWFAEECRRSYGETMPAPVSNKRFITIKQAIGVVAAITPWNFPVAMITRKIAPAIAAGCTVVLRPSSLTPLCALALAHLAKEAGMPAGVLNIVPSSDAKAIGAVLTSHPFIKKLSFTGSTATGKKLMEQCAGTVKQLSLELGGNAPVIVFDDADLDLAVKGTIASKYRNAGQTCVCANRILVQSGIYQKFLAAYKEAVSALKVGEGTQPGVEIGPLVNKAGVEKVQQLLEDAGKKGGEIILGGKPHAAGPLFFEPTIITHCNVEMELSQEEIFGPVSSVFLFDTDAEAIALANNTAYGLAAYFFSQDIRRCIHIAEQLQYGIIGVNEGIISYPEVPFGGVKESGFGKEGSHYGLEEYLETKYICIGGL